MLSVRLWQQNVVKSLIRCGLCKSLQCQSAVFLPTAIPAPNKSLHLNKGNAESVRACAARVYLIKKKPSDDKIGSFECLSDQFWNLFLSTQNAAAYYCFPQPFEKHRFYWSVTRILMLNYGSHVICDACTAFNSSGICVSHLPLFFTCFPFTAYFSYWFLREFFFFLFVFILLHSQTDNCTSSPKRRLNAGTYRPPFSGAGK